MQNGTREEMSTINLVEKQFFFLVRKYVMGASRTILRLLVSEERQSSYKKVPISEVLTERSSKLVKDKIVLEE